MSLEDFNRIIGTLHRLATTSGYPIASLAVSPLGLDSRGQIMMCYGRRRPDGSIEPIALAA